MRRPWLSVVMPTHNGADYLRAALNSVLRQQHNDIEIMAIDDGSTDGTVAILESFAHRLPLRILRKARVGNWVVNTNEALAQAQADYVCLLHQDDLWLPGRLDTLRRLTERAPEAVLLLHGSWFVGVDGRRLGPWRCPLPAGRLLSPAFLIERLLVQNFIAIPAPLFRRDSAQRVGGLDPDLWYTADWDFWLKLAATGPTLYSSGLRTGFRIHPSSQTVARSHQVDEIRQQLCGVFEKHFAAWSGLAQDRVAVRQAGELACELNTHLFAALQGRKASWAQWALRFASRKPAVWHRFLRDSRILERVRARICAGLLRSQRNGAVC